MKAPRTSIHAPSRLRRLLRLLTAFLLIAPASMASTSSYYLDTSRLELRVSSATDTTSGVVKVSSNSNRVVRLKVIPRLWRLNEDGVLTYEDTPPAGSPNFVENIGVNPQEFDLQPGKSRLVRFLVKVPPGVTDGEYRFQLYFQPTSLLEPPSTKEGARTNVSSTLDVVPIFTTTVYVYKGNPTPAIQTDRFECAYTPGKGTFPVTLGLENKGSRHARLFGNILLNRKKPDGSSELMEVLHMQNSTLIIVLPGGHRTVRNDLPSAKKPDPGDYQMELRLVDERNEQPAIQASCNLSVPAGS